MEHCTKRQQPESQRPVLHAPAPPPPEMREPDSEPDSERKKETERGVTVVDFYI